VDWGGCDNPTKAANAQTHGYGGIIVHDNVIFRKRINMGFDTNKWINISIPPLFVN